MNAQLNVTALMLHVINILIHNESLDDSPLGISFN
jgi:hypothetical protein